jgi:hypothetical protein
MGMLGVTLLVGCGKDSPTKPQPHQCEEKEPEKEEENDDD